MLDRVFHQRLKKQLHDAAVIQHFIYIDKTVKTGSKPQL